MEILKAIWPIFILMAAGILFRLFYPQIKGALGEGYLAKLLSSLSKDKYFILNNIMLKTDRGTTQIDHIVVSVYGIFVIETKTYKGWIMGSEHDEYWTQNIYGRKNRFKNPILQNYGHVKALEGLLSEYNDVPLIPVVVFSGECDLKVKLENAKVTYMARVKKLILEYQNEVTDIETARGISELIKNSNIDGLSTRKEHVAAIKANVGEIDEKIKNNVCPKCGGELVRRNGKRGPFTGCSNYPKCRFIVS
jgi:hypothetical protein